VFEIRVSFQVQAVDLQIRQPMVVKGKGVRYVRTAACTLPSNSKKASEVYERINPLRILRHIFVIACGTWKPAQSKFLTSLKRVIIYGSKFTANWNPPSSAQTDNLV